MLCPRAKEKGKNKKRVLYLERKVQALWTSCLQCHSLHVCNSAMVPQERAFLIGREYSHCGLVCSVSGWSTVSWCLWNVKVLPSKASSVTPKTFFQKGGLTQKKNSSRKKAYSCLMGERPLSTPWDGVSWPQWLGENGWCAFTVTF